MSCVKCADFSVWTAADQQLHVTRWCWAHDSWGRPGVDDKSFTSIL